MPRSFDGLTESSASVQQIHEAFGRKDYWAARLAGDDSAATLESLAVGRDGTVAIRISQRIGHVMMPSLITKFVSGDVVLTHTETWTPSGVDQVCGRLDTTVSGGLGSCRATTRLESAPVGCRLRFTGRVQVRIPLLGGNLEKSFGTNLAERIPGVVDFTTTWIAEQL